MASTQTHLIIGGGLAGAKAAQTLREEGFDGRVVLVGEERDRPYERPPLSKDVLAGSKPPESAFVHDEGWYAEHDVELRTGTRVAELDVEGHVATLEGGEEVGYAKALLATGSSPRRLDIPGARLDGVRTLRRVGDSRALAADLSGGGRRVVVIGGGWIGLEVAAAARGYGNDVVVVEPQSTVLRAALGDELGALFAELHREHGVDLRLGTGVTAITEDGGRAVGVVTPAGELPADVVVMGVGAAPRTELAEKAGLAVDNGVLVDASLRTSHPDVFAAGDIANAEHPVLGHRIRVEHWANARHGGPAAAKAMLGQDVSYDKIPYFYTDQYDLGMEYSGHIGPDGYDEVVYRGDRAAREVIAFWLKGNRVVAGMNVNVWDVNDAIADLVRSGAQVDPRRLADPDVPLADLVAG